VQQAKHKKQCKKFRKLRLLKQVEEQLMREKIQMLMQTLIRILSLLFHHVEKSTHLQNQLKLV